MKNTTLFVVIGIILTIMIGFLFVNSKQESSSVLNNTFGKEVQIVKLSVVNGNYVFDPSEVRKGAPVRIEADMSKMPGCSKSIVIPEFGISKTFSANDNVIEFIPDKSGTFSVMCSMNMYRGSFVVLEADGTSSGFVEQVKVSNSGTCSMSSGGGCGCMG